MVLTEKSEIERLPRVSFVAGSKRQEAYVDLEGRNMYFCDGNGNYTGEVHEIKDSAYVSIQSLVNGAAEYAEPEEDEAEAPAKQSMFDRLKASARTSAAPQPQQPAQQRTELDPGLIEYLVASTKQQQSNKGIAALLVCILIALLIVAAALIAPQFLDNTRAEPAPTPVVTATEKPQSIVIAPQEDDADVFVAQAVRNIIAGEKINAEDFVKAGLSTENYNLISASGKLVLWDSLENIGDLTVSDYIRYGDFLSSRCVSDMYSAPDNPYASVIAQPRTFDVDCSTEVGAWHIGDKVSLTISAIHYNVPAEQRTKAETAEAPVATSDEGGEAPETEAVTEEIGKQQIAGSQTTSDVYYISGYISDMYNINGESIYGRLAEYNCIPSYERGIYFSSLEAFDADAFKCVACKVTISQASYDYLESIKIIDDLSKYGAEDNAGDYEVRLSLGNIDDERFKEELDLTVEYNDFLVQTETVRGIQSFIQGYSVPVSTDAEVPEDQQAEAAQ